MNNEDFVDIDILIQPLAHLPASTCCSNNCSIATNKDKQNNKAVFISLNIRDEISM